MRGVGMSSVGCAYMLGIYYSMLLTWVTNAFFATFKPGDPWSEGEADGTAAVQYFFGSIIGMSTLGEDLRPTRIVWTNVGYSVLTWFCIFCCLAFGLKWTGRVAYVTMGLPIVLLFVFLIRACTLTGASDGIRQVSVSVTMKCRMSLCMGSLTRRLL
jgi:SNF family Na+-dependent transporter